MRRSALRPKTTKYPRRSFRPARPERLNFKFLLLVAAFLIFVALLHTATNRPPIHQGSSSSNSSPVAAIPVISASSPTSGSQEHVVEPLSQIRQDVSPASEPQTRISAKPVQTGDSTLPASGDTAIPVRSVAANPGSRSMEPGAIDLDTLVSQLHAPSARIRRLAAQSLSGSKDTRSVDELVTTLRDSHPLVVAAAAESLGRIRNPKAFEPLLNLFNNRNRLNPSPAQSSRSVPFEIDQNTGLPIQNEALDSLADDLYENSVSSDSPAVAIAWALGQLGDRKSVGSLQAALQDKDLRVATSAAQALSALGAAESVIRSMVAKLNDWHANHRAAAVLTNLGWRASTDAEQVFLLVGQRDSQTLVAKWPLTKSVLLKAIDSPQFNTIQTALFAFIALGKEEIIPVLIDKLNRTGNKTMGEAFLNCGEPRLRRAAEDWARQRRYTISSAQGTGSAPVRWGWMGVERYSNEP